jgi:hypothetical protein
LASGCGGRVYASQSPITIACRSARGAIGTLRPGIARFVNARRLKLCQYGGYRRFDFGH